MNTKKTTPLSFPLTSTLSSTYNVLIVEDLSSWRKSFKRFLKHEPFNLSFASDYFEALQKAKFFPFDLIILDVNLSGVPYNVDGLHLAEQIWQWNKKVKVIIVTGSPEWDRRLNAYQFCPSYIIEKKNLDQDDLIAKIYNSIHHTPCSIGG